MAGGGYPVAWRGASIPLAPPAGAFTPAGRVGQVPGTFPNLKPANYDVPRPRFPGVPAAFRIGARFLPLVGYGLLLWELWQLYQQLADQLRSLKGETLPGWTLEDSCPENYSYSCSLNIAPTGVTRWSSGSSSFHCGLRCQAIGEIFPPFTTRTRVSKWVEAPTKSGSLWNMVENWSRPSLDVGSNVPVSGWSAPNVDPFVQPLPLPALIPQILPEAAPPPGRSVPQPRPVPVPYAPYLPRRSPSGEPIRGPRPVRPVPRWPFIPGEEIEPVPGFDPIPNPVPVPVPVPSPVPGPAPVPDAPPGRSPARWPASQIEWAPGRAPRVTRRAHMRRPPRKDERERKQVLNVDRRHVVARAMNAASETCDVVDALYDALPEATRRAYERETWKAPSWWNHRGKGMDVPCQAKAAAVWKYFDQLDWGDAIYNLAYNQIVDFGFGKAGQAAGKVGRDIGRPVGLGTGPAL